jgi:hypothetical protein
MNLIQALFGMIEKNVLEKASGVQLSKSSLCLFVLFACPKVSSFFILSYLLDHNVKKFLSISSKYMSQEFLLDIRVFSLKKSSCLHPLSLGLFSPPIPSLSLWVRSAKLRKFYHIKVWNGETQHLMHKVRGNSSILYM